MLWLKIKNLTEFCQKFMFLNLIFAQNYRKTKRKFQASLKSTLTTNAKKYTEWLDILTEVLPKRRETTFCLLDPTIPLLHLMLLKLTFNRTCKFKIFFALNCNFFIEMTIFWVRCSQDKASTTKGQGRKTKESSKFIFILSFDQNFHFTGKLILVLMRPLTQLTFKPRKVGTHNGQKPIICETSQRAWLLKITPSLRCSQMLWTPTIQDITERKKVWENYADAFSVSSASSRRTASCSISAPASSALKEDAFTIS